MSRPNEYHWTFGGQAHLEFQNGTTLISHSATPMVAGEGFASISHPQSGALLFYTNGTILWDANHTVIATGLGGDGSSTHSAIIVPPPNGSNHYHVFATNAVHGNLVPNDLIHSSYAVTGSGSSVNVQQVTQPAGILGGVLTPERMAATTNADCTGDWIVTQDIHSDEFYSISLTTDTP